ncbi:MAG: hypothetical protein ACI8UR_000804 [Natronomonas sp.]|jgi:hypothetical protein|uniref:hypothetical protein n=1 Tax=Natronomonas sp. TaxID=2184060 RepID=UPI0039896F80
MGTCPYCDAEITVRAELIPPESFEDDNVPMDEEGTIQLEQGSRMFQYVCPECDTILGAGTHKWAR